MSVVCPETIAWLRRRADDVAAMLLIAMFVAFLVQIFMRYVLNWPFGWSTEVCVLAWLWVILWGASFVLEDKEEIRFDILYQSVGARPFPISIAAIVALAVLGAPIGHAMIAGSILYLLIAGQDLAIAAEQLLQGLYGSYILLAIPLFIFAADLMNAGTLSDRLLRFCHALVGRFRGGLGHVNVVASLIFSGMSGSAIADAVGLGRIIINMMTREGRYSAAYAGAITAASATIGPIIPPSIPMVVYAFVSDASIGYLFLGGVVPGFLMAVALAVMNAIMARRRDFPVEDAVTLSELPGITIPAVPALLMPVILLVGIYGGVTTPTEAAALAAAYAFLVSVALYHAITARQARASVLASARSTAAVGLLIAGALVFNYVVTIENVPAAVHRLISGLELSPAGSSWSSTSSCWSWAACWKAPRSCWWSCRCFCPARGRWALIQSILASWWWSTS